MRIYKILRASEWDALRTEGETDGAPIDVADGFVHFSTASQLPATLTKHFTSARDLRLLAVEADGLAADLRWEPSRGGALFPHLYRRLRIDDILWDRPIPDGADGPVPPADLE